MKFVAVFFLFCTTKLFCQDSDWKTKIFNDVLTLNLPSKSQSSKSMFIQAYQGELNKIIYGFQYYDTIFLPIETEKRFQISLEGFISGRVSDSSLKNYDVTITDTTIGGTNGLIAIFTTANSSKFYKRIYYYITLANNQYYWFYVYSPFLNQPDNGIDYFFKSIVFSSEKIKEKSFKLAPVHLTKNIN